MTEKPAASSMTISGGSSRPMSFRLTPDVKTATEIKITREKDPEITPKKLIAKASGIAASVPKVPGAFGMSPVKNQEARTRAVLPNVSAFLKASFNVKVSDWNSDIKQLFNLRFSLRLYFLHVVDTCLYLFDDITQ